LIFKKSTYFKLDVNPSSGSRFVPCGQTDRQTEGRADRHGKFNIRFSQFCERAKKL